MWNQRKNFIIFLSLTQVSVMIKFMKKIAIIGGGASGMMAGIVASHHGAQVTIFEHRDRVGRKLLTTGNGKCNLTNLEEFSVEDTLHFFEQLGLFWKEKNGYVYPVSNQASTVLDLLRYECERKKIRVITECGQIGIKPLNGKRMGGFLVVCNKTKEKFDCIVLATGSKAAPVTGSDGS